MCGRQRWGQRKLGTGKENFIGVGVGIGIGIRNAGDRERECVGVGVCGGKERVQGFKKVQTRLTALVQGFKEGSNAPDGAGSIGFKKVQTRLTRNAGDRERECVGVGVCGEKEKKLKC